MRMGNGVAVAVAAVGFLAGVMFPILAQEPWKEARLFDAVAAGRKDIVEAALAAGKNPNTSRPGYGSLLMHAANYKQLKIIKLLLARGADPRAKGNEGLLLGPIGAGRMDIVKCLVEAGAWVTKPKNACYSDDVLVSAAREGKGEMVRYLLQRGADTEGTSLLCDETALQAAAMRGDVDILEMLVAAGADINHRDCNGQTALMHACEKGEQAAVEFLLTRGADPAFQDGYGRTAETFAAQSEKEDARRLHTLCAGKGGAMPAAPGRPSVPPTAAQETWREARFFDAVVTGKKDTVEAALAAGKDPNMRRPAYGSLLRHAVTTFANYPFSVSAQMKLKQLEIIKLLLAHGANPKAKGNESLVGIAVWAERMDLVKCLVESGAWVTAPRDPCSQPEDSLVLATLRGNSEMVKYLLEHGADPNALGPRGEIALQEAARKGDLEIMTLLVAAGADINHRDYSGMSALMYACKEGKQAAVEFLLSRGANVSFQDGYDRTAEMFATQSKGENVGQLRVLCAGKKL